MGTGPQGVLYHAAARIGYYAPNDPQPGSEAGRYLAAKMNQPWLAGPSRQIWWCMAFVSMCFDLAGEIDAINGFSYNTDVTIRKNPGKFVSVANAKPGDVVIFNWDGNATTDHVGIVEKNLGRGVLQTIEGNTSSGSRGSQSAGNGVWRRQRSAAIAKVIRPSWGKVGGSLASSLNANTDWTLDIDGRFGPKSTMVAQSRAGTKIDGIISGQNPNEGTRLYAWPAVRWGTGGSDFVRVLQRTIGANPNGRLGYETVGLIQQRLNVNVTHIFDTYTAMVWQRHLNTQNTLI